MAQALNKEPLESPLLMGPLLPSPCPLPAALVHLMSSFLKQNKARLLLRPSGSAGPLLPPTFSCWKAVFLSLPPSSGPWHLPCLCLDVPYPPSSEGQGPPPPSHPKQPGMCPPTLSIWGSSEHLMGSRTVHVCVHCCSACPSHARTWGFLCPIPLPLQVDRCLHRGCTP